MSNTHPHYVFVYGTLKRAWGNHRLLVDHKARFISEARTMERFTLTEDFPTIWRSSRAIPMLEPYLGQIMGELYKVTDAGLEACDRLEGHPHSYCRTPTTVEFGPEAQIQRITAGIYIYHSPAHPDLLQKPVDGKLIWGEKDLPAVLKRQAQFKRQKD